MNLNTSSNDQVLAELGRRLRRHRLNANVGQEELARAAGLALKTIQNAEAGRNPSLDTLISILRALGLLDQLDAFLPDPGPSPMQLAELHGKKRQRASGQRGKHDEASDWEW